MKTQEEIKAELAASDVFVLPCIVDGKGASDVLPTVITEAMAAGLPVVSTRLVGVPEMVNDGETGLLGPPGDNASLVDALRRLSADVALRARLGRAGVARAEEVFSLEKTAGQLSGLFESARREDGMDRSGSPKAETPKVLCLIDEWPGDEWSLLNSEVAWLTRDARARFKVVARSCAKKRLRLEQPSIADALDDVEFLPDEAVLDADWAMMMDEAEALVEEEAWREAARQAVHLA